MLENEQKKKEEAKIERGRNFDAWLFQYSKYSFFMTQDWINCKDLRKIRGIPR